MCIINNFVVISKELKKIWLLEGYKVAKKDLIRNSLLNGKRYNLGKFEIRVKNKVFNIDSFKPDSHVGNIDILIKIGNKVIVNKKDIMVKKRETQISDNTKEKGIIRVEVEQYSIIDKINKYLTDNYGIFLDEDMEPNFNSWLRKEFAVYSGKETDFKMTGIIYVANEKANDGSVEYWVKAKNNEYAENVKYEDMNSILIAKVDMNSFSN